MARPGFAENTKREPNVTSEECNPPCSEIAHTVHRFQWKGLLLRVEITDNFLKTSILFCFSIYFIGWQTGQSHRASFFGWNFPRHRTWWLCGLGCFRHGWRWWNGSFFFDCFLFISLRWEVSFFRSTALEKALRIKNRHLGWLLFTIYTTKRYLSSEQ